MDGYTAIVFEGTAVPQTAAEKAAEAAKEEKAAKGAAGSASSDEKRSHELDPAADDDEGKPSEREESGREADERELPEKDAASSAVETEPDASAAAGARSNGTSAKSKPTVTVAEAQKSYEDKKATVFSLDTTDLEQYGEGIILKKGGHRFGVFSVTAPPRCAPSISRLRTSSYKVDFIVAITPDKAYVDDAGIDIVISTQDEDLFVMGETIDGTFYVDAPEAGKVGTILISPSNVVSAKVIEEL
ncbi:MAG: alcohol dehydrogenase [Eggerthella lenta]